MLAFASTTWHGWDYIPHAWDAWLAATDGVLLSAGPPAGATGARDGEGNALAGGQPVAIARVAMLSPTEGWLEGIRVDPRVRGLGIATDLQVAELQWLAASGASVVRYATGQRNEASHRLGARHGFSLLGGFHSCHSHRAEPPWDDDNDPEDEPASGFEEGARDEVNAVRKRLLDELAADGLILAPADAEQWWHRLESDPTFRAGHRLYERRGWTMQELTRTGFERHVAATEVIATDGPAGWGLAILQRAAPPSEDVDVHLGAVAGDGRVLLELVDRLRLAAGRRVRFWLPQSGLAVLHGLEEELAAAHFHLRPWTLHILARPLDDEHPAPAPERPDSLLLEDRPAAVRPTVG